MLTNLRIQGLPTTVSDKSDPSNPSNLQAHLYRPVPAPPLPPQGYSAAALANLMNEAAILTVRKSVPKISLPMVLDIIDGLNFGPTGARMGFSCFLLLCCREIGGIRRCMQSSQANARFTSLENEARLCRNAPSLIVVVTSVLGHTVATQFHIYNDTICC